jgi:hypothetical protein
MECYAARPGRPPGQGVHRLVRLPHGVGDLADERRFPAGRGRRTLGYASVRKEHRNKHLSSRIFAKLLSAGDEPLYAVTSENKMKHLPGKHGFVERGVTSKGRRGDILSFWVKEQD